VETTVLAIVIARKQAFVLVMIAIASVHVANQKTKQTNSQKARENGLF
jgi:hypothetical protein